MYDHSAYDGSEGCIDNKEDLNGKQEDSNDSSDLNTPLLVVATLVLKRTSLSGVFMFS